MTVPEETRTEPDDKGFSEETCVRCGWRMGSPPLNCNNDDTPHVFPSQARLVEAAEQAQRERDENAEFWQRRNAIVNARAEKAEKTLWELCRNANGKCRYCPAEPGAAHFPECPISTATQEFSS